MRYFFYLLICIPFVLISCDESFDVNDEWEDITVVYGILSPDDQVHYLKINKAFLGSGNAYEMAGESDSIQYLFDLDVRLEYIVEGTVQQSIVFRDTIMYKDSLDVFGYPTIFSTENNIIYYAQASLVKGGKYKLVISKPGNAKLVWAETTLMSDTKLRIIKPSNTSQSLRFENYDFSQTIEWLTIADGRLYQPTIRLNYTETLNGVTNNRFIDWQQKSYSSQTVNGGETLRTTYLSRGFFENLKAQIPVIPGVVRRFVGLDFLIFVGSDELNSYIQISKPSGSIVEERPTWTNIQNGYGLFSSKCSKSLLGKVISQQALDSLANGMYTKDLGFVTY